MLGRSFAVSSLEAEVSMTQHQLYVQVIVDKKSDGNRYGCIITLPSHYSLSVELGALLAAGVLLGFAGLCSPKQVILPLLSYDSKKLANLQKIFQLVSDARLMAVNGQESLAENRVEVKCDNSNVIFKKPSFDIYRDSNHVLQLCSGGLDSFCSILKFIEQGKSVNLLHVSGINITNKDNELESTKKISRLLNLDLEIVDVKWRGLKEFGIVYNPEKYDVWPKYNAVPFGRDFILLVLGGWFSGRSKAKIVGIANDLESWHVTPEPTRRDKEEFAVRNELASSLANAPTLEFLNCFIDPELEIVSPLIFITKYAIVDFLANTYGSFIKELSSCFWDNWCGECNKCMIYGLFFAQYETIDVPFKVNPVEAYGLQSFSDETIMEAIKIFNEEVPG